MNIIPAASLLMQAQIADMASAQLERRMSTGQAPATPGNRTAVKEARRYGREMARAFAREATRQEAANDAEIPRGLA